MNINICILNKCNVNYDSHFYHYTYYKPMGVNIKICTKSHYLVWLICFIRY